MEDSSGGQETTLHTCRQAGPWVGELLEGLRWWSCGKERIASASAIARPHGVTSCRAHHSLRHASHATAASTHEHERSIVLVLRCSHARRRRRCSRQYDVTSRSLTNDKTESDSEIRLTGYR